MSSVPLIPGDETKAGSSGGRLTVQLLLTWVSGIASEKGGVEMSFAFAATSSETGALSKTCAERESLDGVWGCAQLLGLHGERHEAQGATTRLPLGISGDKSLPPCLSVCCISELLSRRLVIRSLQLARSESR